MSSFSDRASLNDTCSEQDEYPGRGYYTSNYTSDRPPHLNDDNFSSTQPGGPAYQPRRLPSVDLIGQHVTSVMETSESATNSTVKGGDIFAQRPYLDDYVNRDYRDPTASSSSLTMRAVAALNQSPSYDGNISSWLRAGYNPAADVANNWSIEASVSSKSHHKSHHSSVATNSSWAMIPAANDSQAEIINGVGGWQADLAANPQTTLATSISDEELQDN
ncbi:triacylglycerol lipase [Hypoxylon texense]